MEDSELIRELEERSRLNPERVIRLRGFVADDPFELLKKAKKTPHLTWDFVHIFSIVPHWDYLLVRNF